MRNMCLLVPLLFASAFPHWINNSGLLITSGKRAEMEYDYSQCTAHQEMAFRLDTQKTTKWTIRTRQPSCTLSIVKGSSVIKTCIVDKGSFTFKQQLEPGTYTARSTADARISLYEWRVQKMKAIVPAGGGILAPIVINNKKISYFRASPDTIPEIKIPGPTKAFIYVRVDVPDKEKAVTLDVTVTDKASGMMISHKTATKYRSKKAVYVNNKTDIPGQALIISFDVPDGNHEYAITLKGVHGAVKGYAEVKKRTQKETRNHQRAIRW
jgi:hypothetical protein